MSSASDATTTPASFIVRRAGRDDVAAVAPLFDAYRVFYGQASDPNAALAFLRTRFERSESVLFLAEAAIPAKSPASRTAARPGAPAAGASNATGRSLLGFAQLYPSFSSVSVAPIVILNDLFVAPEARTQGVARALLRRAEEHARETGAVRLVLTTARDNLRAQRVYEAAGWQRDEVFLTYTRTVD